MQGALQAQSVFALVVIVLSTLLNAAYFLPIVYAAFFRKAPEEATHGEAPLPMVIALVATAGGTLALFFFADVVLQLARDMVRPGG